VSDIRPSSAVIRHEASELALELSILDRHLARLRARRQVLNDRLQRALNRLEVREAVEAPMEIPAGLLDVPVPALKAASESPGDVTVLAEIPHGDRCMRELRGSDVCWRMAGHRGKCRGSRAMAKRAQYKRDVRARAGKAPGSVVAGHVPPESGPALHEPVISEQA
jgi:hypothetical protein